MNDRKGGGLMVLFNEAKVEVDKLPSAHKDVLKVRVRINGFQLIMILVYFSVNDPKRNENIRMVVEEELGKVSEGCIVLGDINGHGDFFGQQKLDKNGETIIEWMTKYNLTLLNGLMESEGA